MQTKVVIQAGGKGTRLYPYTKVLPKPLMPVGGMPILEVMIRQLAQGISFESGRTAATIPDLVTGGVCPPTAQHALRQGKRLA